jgi:hypothetical protein
MAINPYIILATSTGSPAYKFKVVEGGYNVVKDKAQTENETIGGIDVAMGVIHEIHEYIVKTRQSRWIITTSGSYRQENDDYGTLDDLEAFYLLNNPKSTPTNIITLTDHYGAVKQAYFVGQFPKKPVSSIIEGGNAIFFMQIRFRVIP